MHANFKWPIFLMVILSLLYRLAFNDSIASNYETPPGYSAPKSIAQIQEEERIAFEKALAENTVNSETVKPVVEKKVRKLATRKLISYRAKKKPVRKLH